jgi:uncharacterized lipoprotein YehR (DUF1307 family)
MGALIEIKELHIHVDLQQTTQVANRILSEVLKIKSIMATTKEELTALLTEIGSAIDNVAGDIDRLAEQATGGITPADADAFKTQLTDLRDKLRTVADKTPEPETEGGEEAPPTEETPA